MDFLDSDVPNTVYEIKSRIERNVQEQFMVWAVPELLFWDLGLEYIGTDTVTMEVKQ